MQEITTSKWWDLPCQALCVTTNGIVTGDGLAVMGAGIAKMFAMKYPQLPAILGAKIKYGGNHVYNLGRYDRKDIYSFPTKHDWRKPSDIHLIIQSAHELYGEWESIQHTIDTQGTQEMYHFALPRPGCGLGGLDWRTQVKPVLEDILIGRAFVIVYNPKFDINTNLQER